MPLLAQFPDEYIYNPWEAPKSVQEAAGCIIGKDYPKPIVDHKIASKDNMRKMKLAYDQDRLINQMESSNTQALDGKEKTNVDIENPTTESTSNQEEKEPPKTKEKIEKDERGD